MIVTVITLRMICKGAAGRAQALGFTFHGCPTFIARLAAIRSNLEDNAKIIITIKGDGENGGGYGVRII